MKKILFPRESRAGVFKEEVENRQLYRFGKRRGEGRGFCREMNEEGDYLAKKEEDWSVRQEVPKEIPRKERGLLQDRIWREDTFRKDAGHPSLSRKTKRGGGLKSPGISKKSLCRT